LPDGLGRVERKVVAIRNQRAVAGFRQNAANGGQNARASHMITGVNS
jgi:hypothetical protein